MPEGAPAGGNSGGNEGTKRDRPLDEERLLRLMRRHGGPNNTIIELLRENAEYREKNRTLTDRVTTLETAATTDKAELDAFRALGKPADLKAIVDEVPALRAFKVQTEADAVVIDAAALMGWQADVLRPLLKANERTVVIKEEKVKDGDETKVVRVAHVRPSGDANAATEPLQDYADTHLAAFLPALTAESGSRGGAGSNGATRPASASDSGRTFPRQGAGAPARKASDAESEKARTETYEKKRRSGIYSM